jgi:hypothetical protein
MLQVTQIRIQISANIKQDTDPDKKSYVRSTTFTYRSSF